MKLRKTNNDSEKHKNTKEKKSPNKQQLKDCEIYKNEFKK